MPSAREHRRLLAFIRSGTWHRLGTVLALVHPDDPLLLVGRDVGIVTNALDLRLFVLFGLLSRRRHEWLRPALGI